MRSERGKVRDELIAFERRSAAVPTFPRTVCAHSLDFGAGNPVKCASETDDLERGFGARDTSGRRSASAKDGPDRAPRAGATISHDAGSPPPEASTGEISSAPEGKRPSKAVRPPVPSAAMFGASDLRLRLHRRALRDRSA